MKRVQVYVRFLVDSLFFLLPLESSGSQSKFSALYRNALIFYTAAVLATRGVSMHYFLQSSYLQTTVVWLGNCVTYHALVANAIITFNLISKADQISRLQKILSNLQVNVRSNSYWYELSLLLNIVRAVAAVIVFSKNGCGYRKVTAVSYQIARMRIEMSIAQLGCAIHYLTSVFEAVNRNLRCRPHLNLLLANRLISSGFECIELLNDVWGLFIANSVFLYLIELVQYSMNMRAVLAEDGGIYLQLYIASIIICGLYVLSLALFGEQLGNEVRRTVNSCTEMAHCAPRIFTVEPGRDFEEKFLIVAQNVHQRSGRINAAGFFSVDHSMILLVASNVCTYLLVACQLS